MKRRIKIRKNSWVGMRMLKTGLAVVFTLMISSIGIIINPVYATIGTVLVMQQTIRGSYLTGKNRLLGTALGGVIAFLVITIFQSNHALLIGLSVILTISICNKLKINEGVSIALTVVLSILIEAQTKDPLIYSAIRVWDTSIGVLVGLIVNYLIAQPNYEKKSEDKLSDLKELLNRFLAKEQLIVSETELKSFRRLIKEIDLSHQRYVEDLRFHNGSDELGEDFELCHDIYFHVKSLYLLAHDENQKEVPKSLYQYHQEKLIGISQKLCG